MTAGTWNFVIEQGVTWSCAAVWTDNSIPVDLTGYSARMSIRHEGAQEASMHLSTDNGRIAIDGSAGELTLTLSAEDTASIPAVEHRHDLELVAPDGQVIRLLQGRVDISEEQTRDGDA